MKHIPFLMEALSGGNTKRCHTLRVLEEENVASHSFGVAWICAYLCGDDKPDAFLLLAALAHDLPEQETGDMPADVKKLDPELGDRMRSIEDIWLSGRNLNYAAGLSQNEKVILKLADSFHLMWKCIRERQMGNTTMGLVWWNLDNWMNDLILRARHPATYDLAKNLRSMLQSQWELCNGS